MIHIVTGQTATGKTEYALDLAKKYAGELVNCDARQVYKKLDIITGKDLHLINQTTNIWLYDIVDPKEPFSSHDYRLQAIPVITDILSRNKTPIIVGGTYFYLKNLLYDIQDLYIPPNWDLRHELNNKSIDELQQMMKVRAPDMFAELNNSEKNNPQRLIRKIEIARTGTIARNTTKNAPYEFSDLFKKNETKITGFTFRDKKDLQTKITKRVNERIKNGALHEVKQLLSDGYDETNPGLKTIGYIQCIKYLQNHLTYEKMVEEWIRKEVQYAKRQLTFMKADPHINWIEV